MFNRRSEKLYRVKERLEGVIDELDALLVEARAMSGAESAQKDADDSDLVRQIAEQREVLAAIVAVIVEATSDVSPSD
jgi:hypothetical protein